VFLLSSFHAMITILVSNGNQIEKNSLYCKEKFLFSRQLRNKKCMKIDKGCLMVEKLLNVQLFTVMKSSGVLLIMTHPNSMTKANATTILRPVSCLKTSIHPSSRLERLRLDLLISENLWDQRWGNKLCLSQNVSSLKTIEDFGVLRMTTLSNVSLLTNVIHLETWKYLIRLLLST